MDTEFVNVGCKLLKEDAELLTKVAEARGYSRAELIRSAIYAQVEPLRRAQAARQDKTYNEVFKTGRKPS